MARIPTWRLVVSGVSLSIALLIVVPIYMDFKGIRFGPPPREQTIELSMRDYTFNGTNPTFRFHVGDHVRFVVRNEEQTPIRHNFAIPSLGIPCAGELGPGEIRHVFVTLKKPGTFEYVCCTHRGMGGTLIVTR
jgi:plastocyanin